MKGLIERIETYITDYVTLADRQYSLPIALWILGTFCFKDFDAYPYLVINSPTKRSGKTRLAEMISFCCNNPRAMSALTGPTLFRLIEKETPTILFDEAEGLNSEASSVMRSVLNVGYRRGQTIPRVGGDGNTVEFATYCPKIFILIGDVYDTLRDRSIVITMQRAEAPKRFTFEAVRTEGNTIRLAADAAVKSNSGNIQHAFRNHNGLPFLMDRDEEIWTALFCLAQVFCPDRLRELQGAAADMAAEKTAEGRAYTDMEAKENEANSVEYGKKCLMDLWGVFVKDGVKYLRTEDVITKLKEIPTSPWRKFRGAGVDAHDLSNLMQRFDVRPVRIALGSGRGKQKFYRGYKRTDVEKAMGKL